MAGATLVSSGGSVALVAANDYATRVFLDLSLRIPQIFQKFGFTKGQVKAWVSDSDQFYGIFWCTSPSFSGCTGVTDVIKSNHTRVFNVGGFGDFDGLFVTTHEYGHSYHWFAVENWSFAGGNCGSGHSWSTKNTLGCAFVEGIADWISMVTIGSTISHSPYWGDYGIENNEDTYFPTNPPAAPNNDGALVENSFASFLYDVIDNGTELDGFSNTIGAAETWDNFATTPNNILSRIKYCKINGTITQLSGVDQLVYCLEGNTSAYSEASFLSPAWRNYSTVSFEQSVPPLNSAQIRALWEYNLYGIQ